MFNRKMLTNKIICVIWGSHGAEEDDDLLDFDAV
jgi:hypothetical protein